MKKIILLILLVIANSTFAQNCNIGNEDPTGFDNSGDPIYKDYLLGVKFYLSTNGVLTSLNLIGRNTGSQVQLAIYEDNAGVPGNLIVSTNTTTVGTGIISLPVTPTQLTEGYYWIMGIYSIDGGHTYSNVSSENTVYYQSLTFGSAIPQNGSGFSSYTGTDFTYYAEITCGTLEISNFDDLANVSFYPNPASDLFTINVVKNLIGSTYIITDLLGKQILTGRLNNETSSIDISQLETGVYLLLIGQQRTQTLKLIKK